MNTIRKPIGVCLAQAHTSLKTELLSELDRAARENGIGVIAFNSSLDYYWSQKGDHITACIYDMIRFDLLSALVILHDNIYDLTLTNRLVRSAHQQKIPVFYLGGSRADCITIEDDYETSYKQLVRHVIRDHGVRDTFFIAGLRNEDNAVRRLRYYREVLEECGLPFREENVAYGNYLDILAADIVRELAATRKDHMPQAILCANDSMAAATIDELKALGFRVPQDIIVTGFDGTPIAYLGTPQLTTCSSNPGDLADQIISLTKRFYDGELMQKVYRHGYKTVLTESCGCQHILHPRYNALRTFRQAEGFTMHENGLYYSIEQLLELKDHLEIFRKLSGILLPGSAIYLNRSLIESDPETEYRLNRIEDELVMIPYRKPEEQLVFRKVYRRDMPLPEQDLQRGTHLLNVLHSDELVFGYFAAHTEDLYADAQLIKRVSDVMNLVISILAGRRREERLIAKLEDNLYRDPLTGMDNLKGLTRWFGRHVSDPDSHRKLLAMSVYAIPNYSYLFETYGMEETDLAVCTVADNLRAANPEAAMIARMNESQFAVLNVTETGEKLSGIIDRNVQTFFNAMESHNARSSREFFLEVNCGCTTLQAGWESTSLENLIHLAVGEMYLNRLSTGAREQVAKAPIGPERYEALSLLLEKNLFYFVFQPIVDARNGQIYAYEALMRTREPVVIDPMQILAIAREYNRLYDVERMTIFDIMGQYVRDYNAFQGRKLFINTIPGHFLTEEDCNELVSRYGNYLDCFDLELTEDEPATDEELKRMKRLSRPGSSLNLAIDDYGTGHSNIVNLLRYSPQVIKIDRALISGVDRNSNQQLFVRNTIEFAHQNGIRVLAEGVETSEEMQTVIRFGVDLIQGFYTGYPQESPIPAIDEGIRSEIIRENLQAARYDSSPLTYTMKDGETADLIQLALKRINCIHVDSGNFTLQGTKGQSVDMILRVGNHAEAVITLDQISMRGVNEPTVVLGHNSHVTFVLKGQNLLTKEGVIVPPDSEVIFRGDGNLHINNNRNYSAGIGASYDEAYGTVILDVGGKISFSSTGDRVICIGGGRSGGEGIRLIRGNIEMIANGINVLCIGSSMGNADIRFGSNIHVRGRGEGNEVLVIGSISGTAVIRSMGRLEVSAAAERAAGIGTLSGTAEILFENSSVIANLSCDSGTAIGNYSGQSTMVARDTALRIHGEGDRIVGCGSLMGTAESRFESGGIQGELLAGRRLMMGNEQCRCVVTGGNFDVTDLGSFTPVSPDGTELSFRNPDGDHYERTFRDTLESWTYRADRNKEGNLGVFIPREG